jgi:hypothetical protein
MKMYERQKIHKIAYETIREVPAIKNEAFEIESAMIIRKKKGVNSAEQKVVCFLSQTHFVGKNLYSLKSRSRESKHN